MKILRISKRVQALTLFEMLWVIAAIVVLLMLVLPAINWQPRSSRRIICMQNLRQIDFAYLIWAQDHGGRFPMTVSTNEGGSREFEAGNGLFRHFQVVLNQLSDPKLLVCPLDVRRQAVDFASLSNGNISYFLGLDATTSLTNMFLVGDRNLVTNGEDAVPGPVIITTNEAVGWSAKMHNGRGQIAFVDGSVKSTPNSNLQTALRRTGTNINRLAVP